MARMYYVKELKEFMSHVPDDAGSICLDCGQTCNGEVPGSEKLGWEYCTCDENQANEIKYKRK